jgi:hypothetical protein
MSGLWLLITGDVLDDLAEPWDTIATVTVVLAILILAGVYSARTALYHPEKKDDWRFLIGIGLRTALLLGLSASLISVFGD